MSFRKAFTTIFLVLTQLLQCSYKPDSAVKSNLLRQSICNGGAQVAFIMLNASSLKLTEPDEKIVGVYDLKKPLHFSVDFDKTFSIWNHYFFVGLYAANPDSIYSPLIPEWPAGQWGIAREMSPYLFFTAYIDRRLVMSIKRDGELKETEYKMCHEVDSSGRITTVYVDN